MKHKLGYNNALQLRKVIIISRGLLQTAELSVDGQCIFLENRLKAAEPTFHAEQLNYISISL